MRGEGGGLVRRVTDLYIYQYRYIYRGRYASYGINVCVVGFYEEVKTMHSIPSQHNGANHF